MTNVADHIFRQARDRADKTGLIFRDQAYSFAQIADQVRRTAGGLAAAGIGPGARVGLMSTARPDFIFFEYALFALGATLSPLNIFYRRGELLHVVESCDLEYLIVDSEFVERLPPAGTPGSETLKKVLVIDADPAGDDPRLMSAQRLIDGAQPIAEPVSMPDEAIVLMLNTSATTGKAKGVMLSLANIRANYDRTPGRLGLDETTVTLCALPLYNTFGINPCVHAIMVTGGTLVLMPRFEAAACLEAIERHRCTFLPGVPTLLQKLIEHPDAAARDLSSVRKILLGGAPIPASLLLGLKRLLGEEAVVLVAFGLTEAAGTVSFEPAELDEQGNVRRPKSIGFPVSGVEMCILREDGSRADPDEVGEICIRGPNVMQGYYKQPEDTAIALAHGWLHTGDLGTYDSDGRLYIVDRKKDVIIRGGQNLYPAEVEEVIYHMPGVSEVAVVAAPDETLGEVPHAYVATLPGVTISPEAIIARCKEELAHYKVPTAVHLMAELPKGPTGKILRRALR